MGDRERGLVVRPALVHARRLDAPSCVTTPALRCRTRRPRRIRPRVMARRAGRNEVLDRARAAAALWDHVIDGEGPKRMEVDAALVAFAVALVPDRCPLGPLGRSVG